MLYFFSSRIKKKKLSPTKIIFKAIAGILELEIDETTTAIIKRLIVSSSSKLYFERILMVLFKFYIEKLINSRINLMKFCEIIN